jgi:hypothetical protein
MDSSDIVDRIYVNLAFVPPKSSVQSGFPQFCIITPPEENNEENKEIIYSRGYTFR